MTQVAPAGWYPDPENPARQRYWDGVGWTQHMVRTSTSQDAPNDFASPGGAPQPVVNAPVLQAWKTSVGFSVLGLVLGTPLLMILSMILATLPMILFGMLTGLSDPQSFSPILALVGNALMLGYAVKIYPSYFSEKPRLKSSKLISFANFMFGGLIFGLLWNGNLTKRTKGISYVVSAVFSGLMCLWLAFSVFGALILGETSNAASAPGTTSSPAQTLAAARNVQPLERTSDANIHTDANTGASFVIPDTWSEQPFIASERQQGRTKFRVPGNGGTAFYLSNSLSPEDPRQDMDDWSDEDIRRLAGLNSSDVTVERVTLNGVEYFVTITRESGADNVNVFHIRDGHVYGFQYVEAGTDIEEEALRTFFSMAASAVYPSPVSRDAVPESPSSAPTQLTGWSPSDVEPLERTNDADLYTDAETGASFVIPSDWSQQPQQGRTDNIKSLLRPDDAVNWSSWATYARTDHESSPLVTGDESLEDLLERRENGSPDPTVKIVTLGGNLYVLLEVAMTTPQDGEDAVVHGVQLIHIEGNRSYEFMYYTGKNASTEDAIGSAEGDWQTFLSMVASADYP